LTSYDISWKRTICDSKDLVDVFGTESIVSDVLNGKRDLAKDHIRKLSERFGVSPALFF
jgi:HTH-type transcriptional regulator/antitoxin HigA